MGNFLSTADIKRAALRTVGENTDGTSQYDSTCMEYINDIYFKILSAGNVFEVNMAENWVWAKAQYPGVLELIAPYMTGTISVTNASTAATLSGAPSAGLGSFAGRLLKIDGRPEFFYINAHTAGSASITLDANYTDTTGSGLSYKIYKLEYALASNILRLFSPMIVYRNQDVVLNSAGEDRRIHCIDLAALQRDFPLYLLQDGTPTRFAQVYESATAITVRFNKAVDVSTRVEYDYIPIPTELQDTDASVPLIPREHRCVLQYGAQYKLAVDKNDQRAPLFLQEVQAQCQAMINANRKDSNMASNRFGLFEPRQENVQSKRVFIA